MISPLPRQDSRNGPVPPSNGVHSTGPKNPVPSFIYIAGWLTSMIGMALFFIFGLSGFNSYTIAGLGLLVGGVLVVISGKILFGDAIARHNLKCKGLWIFSFLMMMAGAILGILVFVGSFNQGKGGPWGVSAAALFIAGTYGYHYSETHREVDKRK